MDRGITMTHHDIPQFVRVPGKDENHFQDILKIVPSSQAARATTAIEAIDVEGR
jgi:hypothetical protein